jgi:hypothetical protein
MALPCLRIFPRGLVFPLGHLNLLGSHIFSRNIEPSVHDPLVHPLSPSPNDLVATRLRN